MTSICSCAIRKCLDHRGGINRGWLHELYIATACSNEDGLMWLGEALWVATAGVDLGGVGGGDLLHYYTCRR